MTVALVIVSHSAQLASGVAELARQTTKGAVPIIPTGGVGQVDDSNGDILGTSADVILAAIQSVAGPDGVLVLFDMGSALLSTEMALELLDEQQRATVVLTYAPLVEGTIAAAVEASLGRSLTDVKRAAEQTAQVEQLRKLKPITQDETIAEQTAQPETIPMVGEVHEISLTLRNPAGLHMRPASLFVQTAARFRATIHVQTRGKQADATSIMSVLSLGARQGDTIVLRATGADAQAALAEMITLVHADFYETPSAPSTANSVSQSSLATATSTPQQPNTWQGISASAGVAIGPAFLYTSTVLDLSTVQQRTIAATSIATEQQRLQEALQAAAHELDSLAQHLQNRAGKAEAAIFVAQALIVRDPALHETATHLIEDQHLDASSALTLAAEQYASQLAKLDNPVLAARAADVRDATSRAVQRLGGPHAVQQDLSSLSKPIILVARDLTPSDTAQLHPEIVLGICTTQGGATSHAAILARALGIPAIAGLDESLLERIHSNDELGLDADAGLLYLHPSDELRNTLTQRITERRQQQSALKAAAQSNMAPLTIEGRRILLRANVGSEAEAEAARLWGAEGIGLLRTEFLFAGATTLPDEQEQRTHYTRVFQAFRGDREASTVGPIVVRTLDAGADKPLPALQQIIGTTTEANPALGLRGIRIHLAHQHLLKQQLRALLLAASDTGVELHIMFPMMSTVEELRTIRTLFTDVQAELTQRQALTPPASSHIPLGIMIEVPAAAVMTTELAELADFFSIGANDLLQYTLAADRTNTAVATLYNPMQPALLRLIQQIANAGHRAGKPVAVCGEIASDPHLAPLLVALGVDELSMTPTALPAIRTALTGRTAQELAVLAERAVNAKTVAEVEAICAAKWLT
ncbi:MAG: phosphoenolpyruvate--protein phosphotransferase [Ktedonobacteraceae bacterium]|nr:phosphoenolpyruvate--protein phosphotransferase [Ktedonobacteraceae bacterium]